MSLFQCERCGCAENTALASQGFKPWPELFDWTGIEDRKGMRLCSVCGPTKYSDGSDTEYGKWHGRFARTFLPLGMFKTNAQGNLAHIETGDTDYRKYATDGVPAHPAPLTRAEFFHRVARLAELHADDQADHFNKECNALADACGVALLAPTEQKGGA